MGGTATLALAVAVADAGALGMLAMPTAPAAAVTDALDSVRRHTAGAAGAVGIDFLAPFVDRDAVAASTDRARVVAVFYGQPDPSLVTLIHDGGGALASWQVGSVDEARAAVDAGCDPVVVQGVEAGGHVRGEVGLLPLLDQVLGVVGVPVVAAGGIGTARSVAAVLAAGAAGARGRHPVRGGRGGRHPPRLHRCAHRIGPGGHRSDDDVLGAVARRPPPRPAVLGRRRRPGYEEIVGETVLPDGARLAVGRFTPPAPGRATTGQVDAMALYAGQSVGAVRRRQPAGEIVRELTADL